MAEPIDYPSLAWWAHAFGTGEPVTPPAVEAIAALAELERPCDTASPCSKPRTRASRCWRRGWSG